MRKEDGEYQLTPSYNFISTVIHARHESDTALNLYDGDLNSPFYVKYGYYGRGNFMELAKGLEIIDNRAEHIIDTVLLKKKEMEGLLNNPFLNIRWHLRQCFQ